MRNDKEVSTVRSNKQPARTHIRSNIFSIRPSLNMVLRLKISFFASSEKQSDEMFY